MKKTGFSLMEVLMVIGIIGVVTAMGLSISQKGVEKAYRQYWYTGYKALADATFDAGVNGKLANSTDYHDQVKNVLKLDSNGKAPNGIKFTFASINGLQHIAITIPSPKTKKAMNNTNVFIYNASLGVLYPANLPTTTGNYINLQDRVDILPFIINDGYPRTKSVNNHRHDRKIYSFKEAYCKTHNNQSINDSNNMNKLTCPSGLTTVNGVMQLADPQKVF